MSDLSTELLPFCDSIKEFGRIKVLDILKKYENIPPEHREFLNVESALRKERPYVFGKLPQHGNGKELPLKEKDGSSKRGPQSDAERLIEAIRASLVTRKEYIKSFYKKIQALFPSELYTCSFRDKSLEGLRENILQYGEERSLLDIIGIRIVPHASRSFPSMTEVFEREFANEIAFKLNTFAFTEDELVRNLGKHSLHYRATHYYIAVDTFYIEIQIRTPGVDQWSIVHHDTMYKNKIPVTEQQKESIMEFGRMATIVDYFEMLEAITTKKSLGNISRFNIAAVIFDTQGRVLLCKRSASKKIAPGKWRFPGGKIDDGETHIEAIKRELKEELSVEIVSVIEVPHAHIYLVGDERYQTHYAQVSIKGEITLNYENDAWAYVAIDDIPQYVETDHLPITLSALDSVKELRPQTKS